MTKAIIINEQSSELAAFPVNTTSQNADIQTIIISANRKSTKEQPLRDDQRIRNIVIPASYWEGIDVDYKGEQNQPLQELLNSALRRLASERLAELLEESNHMATTVPVREFQLSRLLAWSVETAASRGAIPFTKDELAEWYDASATRAALVAANKPANVLAYVRTRFLSLAAKNHGLSKESDALKLLSLVADADTSSSTGQNVVSRITAIAKNLAAKEAEGTLSMDSI